MTRNDWLKAATMWNQRSVSVVPAVYRTKRAAVQWKKWATELPSDDQLNEWAQKKWPCNLAVILTLHGNSSPLVVLDFDDRSAYYAWRKRHPILSDTYTVRTGRGVHAYIFVWDACSKTERFTFMGRPAGEIKSSGYVIGWPSVHPNGTVYSVMNNVRIQEVAHASQLGIERIEIDPEIVTSSPSPNGNGIVEKIKSELPVQLYLSKFTTLRGNPDGTYTGICPFHDDTNPSLQIWPTEGRFYCHSPGCIAHRRCDVINACAFAYNISSNDAISLLAREVSSE